MYIKEMDDSKGLGLEEKKQDEEKSSPGDKALVEAAAAGGGEGSCAFVVWDAKRIFIGVGGRALFYPTLLYNVVRNKIQAEFRWWDWIDEFVLLGAIPFRSDVSRLKELGVSAVITLNEPHETLVPTSLYREYGIHHLVIPTRDYLFAPSLSDICRAVDFIHENASCGQSTYVHCKAGRGRSTTIVICYLVKYKLMMPHIAYDYVKAIRPRVLLASAQWQAVQEFYCLHVKKDILTSLVSQSPRIFAAQDLLTFDDGSVVVITKADLDGYDRSEEPVAVRNGIWADLSLIYRVRVAGGAALARLSCLWLRCHAQQKISCEELAGESGCSIGAKRLGGFTVDIHVYA